MVIENLHVGMNALDDLHGHASMFNLVPTYAEQIDRPLGDLFAGAV